MIVVLYSGGIGSYSAAKRLVSHGAEVTLLFTDTLIEDEELYEFLDASRKVLGVPLVRIADGRTPWEVFKDVRMIGNTRIDPCSRILKRDLARKWMDSHFPDGGTLALGIDWSEQHRFVSARTRWLPHTAVAPMCDEPLMEKRDMLAEAERDGLKIPRLYRMGFAHNNCGGFCVKAGQGHFAKLLQEMPERYAEHEAKEEEMRKFLDADVSILRDRRGGQTKPYTLRKLREDIEAGCQYDMFDIGGCGCMTEAP